MDTETKSGGAAGTVPGGKTRKAVMNRKDERDLNARQRAEAQWAKDRQRNAEAVSQREKERQADMAKTARLRALRLAKEAAEREAAAAAPAAAKTKSRKA